MELIRGKHKSRLAEVDFVTDDERFEFTHGEFECIGSDLSSFPAQCQGKASQPSRKPQAVIRLPAQQGLAALASQVRRSVARLSIGEA